MKTSVIILRWAWLDRNPQVSFYSREIQPGQPRKHPSKPVTLTNKKYPLVNTIQHKKIKRRDLTAVSMTLLRH